MTHVFYIIAALFLLVELLILVNIKTVHSGAKRLYKLRKVICDMVYSDGQKRVIDALLLKTKKANEMFEELNSNINNKFELKTREFNKEIILPNFLKK